MKCPNCGEEVTGKFCTKCGTPAPAQSEPVQQPEPMQYQSQDSVQQPEPMQYQPQGGQRLFKRGDRLLTVP